MCHYSFAGIYTATSVKIVKADLFGGSVFIQNMEEILADSVNPAFVAGTYLYSL